MNPASGPIAAFTAVGDARPDDIVWPLMSWPPPAGIRLTGTIVELSPCVPERHAAPLFQALHHDSVWRHLPGRPHDADGYEQFLKRRLAEGRFPWIVTLRRPYAGLPSAAIVGTASYLDVSPTDARLEIGATAYTPAVWATKVNPEVKLLLLGHAFDTLRVGRVQLKTDVRNVRSQHAIAKLGARYEATLRRYQRRDDGTVRDSVLFSLIAEDWPEARQKLLTAVNRPEG